MRLAKGTLLVSCLSLATSTSSRVGLSSRRSASRLFSNGSDLIQATELFSAWAVAGKDEKMARGHLPSVLEMLNEAKKVAPSNFGKPFRFLDIGCGNGWVTRMVSESFPSCIKSTGLDGASEMIRKAHRLCAEELSLEAQEKCDYLQCDLTSFQPPSPVDIAFSMV